MSVIVLLIVAGGVVAGGFLAAFAWAVRTGQFDDVATPPVRMLLDESHGGPGLQARTKPGAEAPGLQKSFTQHRGR